MAAHLARSLQINASGAPLAASVVRRRSEESSPSREETFRQMQALNEANSKVVSWVPDSLADRCYHCEAIFSLVLRRHHCRRCGNVFCDSCSSSRMPLVSAGFFTPVRVCDKCCEAAKKTHRRMYNERRRLSQSAQDLDTNGHGSHNDLHSLFPLSPIDDSESSYAASPAAHLLTTMIDVINGEIVSYRSPNVRLRIPNGCEYAGNVYISNYRLVFSQASAECISSSEACQRSHRRHPTVLPTDQFTAAPRYHAIPLRSIERIKRQEIAESDTGILHVVCKDMRRIQLVFLGLVKQQTFSQFDRCDRELKVRGQFFAKINKESFPHATILDGWTVYDPVAEFNRLGVGGTTKWRITDINQTYTFCPTYSAAIVVPATISDQVLSIAGAFRSKSRIPVLSWRDKKSGATICRSSQPLVGLGQKQCAEDVMLIQAIAAANPSSSTMIIIDARPWRNAMAQKTVAMAGYELTAHYEVKQETDKDPSLAASAAGMDEVEEKTMMLGLTTCRLVFMGIENIHVMRKSYQKLTELCVASDQVYDPPGRWHEQLAQTKWLDHLSRILYASVEIARLIKTDKASVLVHCSDGWDRTSQLTSLAELMLDPYYRTIRGFALLVEKDWCSFGYKFCERTGHIADPSSQEISVVFVQWIDCVWQIWRQFPCSFEFNTRFLILILDHLYSCRFGTFLYDSEQHRVQEESKEPTVSLWTYLSSLEPSFITNPFYEPRKYSRQNWHARIVERRQANEYAMSQWQQQVEPASDGQGLVGLEEKEDGVVLVHTDSSQHLEEITSPSNSTKVANMPALIDPPIVKKPKKKIHSIVQDLDTGLMFPHVIETVASPLPSPSFTMLNDLDYGQSEIDIQEEKHGEDEDEESSESEGSQASSQDVRSFGPDADVLIPSVSVKCLRLWTDYYLRWDAGVTVERHGDLEREAKLRDVLGELEYYKRKRTEKEIVGNDILYPPHQPTPCEMDSVGLSVEALFEAESMEVVGQPLSTTSLRLHNESIAIADLQRQHRLATDRLQMQYEDWLSCKL